MNHAISMSPFDWLDLFLHFAVMSLLSFGGTITTAPEMHRYLVDDQRWLTDAAFSSSIALAQSAPGPNVLFVALIGWNIGINAGGGMAAGLEAWALGSLGILASMGGIMLPSSVLTSSSNICILSWSRRFCTCESILGNAEPEASSFACDELDDVEGIVEIASNSSLRQPRVSPVLRYSRVPFG